MYKNLVFFPTSDALRSDLFKLGLDFLLVKLEGKSQFMVITSQMAQAQQLAVKHNIQEFIISDSRRQMFQLKLKEPDNYGLDLYAFFGAAYDSNKLGRLSKDLEKKGNPFLVVTEDNTTHHWIVE